MLLREAMRPPKAILGHAGSNPPLLENPSPTEEEQLNRQVFMLEEVLHQGTFLKFINNGSPRPLKETIAHSQAAADACDFFVFAQHLQFLRSRGRAQK